MLPVRGLPDHEPPVDLRFDPLFGLAVGSEPEACTPVRRGRRSVWLSHRAWQTRPARPRGPSRHRDTQRATARRRNGGPSHHATRPLWLKIAAAPLGQPGSLTGSFPSPPVDQRERRRGRCDRKHRDQQPGCELAHGISPGERTKSHMKHNGPATGFLGPCGGIGLGCKSSRLTELGVPVIGRLRECPGSDPRRPREATKARGPTRICGEVFGQNLPYTLLRSVKL